MTKKQKALEVLKRNGLEYEILRENAYAVHNGIYRNRIEVFLPNGYEVSSIICDNWQEVIDRLEVYKWH